MTEESLSGDANGLSETAKPYIFRKERALVVPHWLRKHGRSAFPALRCGFCDGGAYGQFVNCPYKVVEVGYTAFL